MRSATRTADQAWRAPGVPVPAAQLLAAAGPRRRIRTLVSSRAAAAAVVPGCSRARARPRAPRAVPARGRPGSPRQPGWAPPLQRRQVAAGPRSPAGSSRRVPSRPVPSRSDRGESGLAQPGLGRSRTSCPQGREPSSRLQANVGLRAGNALLLKGEMW